MTAEKQDGQPLRRRDSSTSSKPKHLRGGPQTAPAEIILTPAQYLDTITLPTVAEFLDDLGNPRRAYLACMVTAHLVDQVTRSQKVGKEQVREAISALGGYRREALEIVEGICNGTKHAGTGRDAAFPFAPGHEMRRHAFEFDVDGRGFDEADWDIPGLTVSHRQVTYFIDECVRATIWSFMTAYPNHFAGVDHVTITKPGLDRWGVPV